MLLRLLPNSRVSSRSKKNPSSTYYGDPNKNQALDMLVKMVRREDTKTAEPSEGRGFQSMPHCISDEEGAEAPENHASPGIIIVVGGVFWSQPPCERLPPEQGADEPCVLTGSGG